MNRGRRRSLGTSFSHAWHGWRAVFRDERNIRIHSVSAVAAIILAFPLNFSATELAIIFLMSGAVIATELMNAALERYSDIVKPRVSGYVEQVKDIAAASVLVLSVTAVAVGTLLYIPKIMLLLRAFFTV